MCVGRSALRNGTGAGGKMGQLYFSVVYVLLRIVFVVAVMAHLGRCTRVVGLFAEVLDKVLILKLCTSGGASSVGVP